MLAPKKILAITKHRFFGDTIIAIPALRALHTYFPDAPITLLTGSAAAEMMQGCPYVAEVIVHEGLRDKSSIKERYELLRWMKRSHFDLAFIFDRSFFRALLVRMAGVPERVGLNAEGRSCLLTKSVRWDRDKHELECLLDITTAFNVPDAGKHLELWLSDDEKSEPIEKFGLINETPRVVIHPGTNDSYIRQWPAGSYAEVAAQLYAETQCQIILVGSKAECDAAGAVAQRLTTPYLNCAGQTSLREVFGILANCDLLIGADTGLMHAAVALGISTIGIYGPTKAKRWAHDTPINRSFYTTTTSPHPSDTEIRACLDAIKPSSIAEAALNLLQKRKGSQDES
jgi:lipopolysaccharide heptosyltransferase II